MLERLQKILSARGIASRRKAEEYIEQGLVKVNGKTATLGQKADPEIDKIEVDGKVLQARQEMLYYVMYKPRGVITTNDSKASNDPKESKDKSVRDILPLNLQGKLFPVGRLDKDSEGLLLFTNDGVLAYRLTHPKFDHEKEYVVTVKDPIKNGQIMKMEQGLMLDGVKTKPAKITRLDDWNFRIALTEGKNRQIRRMVQKVGGEVTRLCRMRIMSFEDRQLKPGSIRALTEAEKQRLLQSVGV